MKINCISCGHNMDLDSAYANYEGDVKCWVCGELLQMKAEEGDIISVKTASQAHLAPAIERISDFKPHALKERKSQEKVG